MNTPYAASVDQPGSPSVSVFAFSSATFAGASESFIPKKTETDSKSIFEKPLLIAENIEDNPASYVGFDTLKITVTGTRTERAIKDVPSAITSYDYDEVNSLAPLSLSLIHI